jgi:hypothetical protein
MMMPGYRLAVVATLLQSIKGYYRYSTGHKFIALAGELCPRSHCIMGKAVMFGEQGIHNLKENCFNYQSPCIGVFLNQLIVP